LQALEGFITNYRYERGGYDLLAARGADAAQGGGPVFQVRPNVKTVRRGAEFGLKTEMGILPVDAAEIEAAGWIIARPSITEAALALAFPAVNAPALIAKLRAAEILVAA